jgi:hypothetical protein
MIGLRRSFVPTLQKLNTALDLGLSDDARVIADLRLTKPRSVVEALPLCQLRHSQPHVRT